MPVQITKIIILLILPFTPISHAMDALQGASSEILQVNESQNYRSNFDSLPDEVLASILDYYYHPDDISAIYINTRMYKLSQDEQFAADSPYRVLIRHKFTSEEKWVFFRYANFASQFKECTPKNRKRLSKLRSRLSTLLQLEKRAANESMYANWEIIDYKDPQAFSDYLLERLINLISKREQVKKLSKTERALYTKSKEIQLRLISEHWRSIFSKLPAYLQAHGQAWNANKAYKAATLAIYAVEKEMLSTIADAVARHATSDWSVFLRAIKPALRKRQWKEAKRAAKRAARNFAMENFSPIIASSATEKLRSISFEEPRLGGLSSQIIVEHAMLNLLGESSETYFIEAFFSAYPLIDDNLSIEEAKFLIYRNLDASALEKNPFYLNFIYNLDSLEQTIRGHVPTE